MPTRSWEKVENKTQRDSSDGCFQVTSQKRMEPNEHLSSVPLFLSQLIVNAGTCDLERGSGFRMRATDYEEIQRW